VSKEFNSQLTFNPKNLGLGFVEDEAKTPAKPYFIYPEKQERTGHNLQASTRALSVAFTNTPAQCFTPCHMFDDQNEKQISSFNVNRVIGIKRTYT